jgi:hypothetical protein
MAMRVLPGTSLNACRSASTWPAARLVYVVADPWLDDFRVFLERHAALLRAPLAWTLRIVVPPQFPGIGLRAKQVVWNQLLTPSICASSVALIPASVGPLGIGTSGCCRTALPRDSTPPLSWLAGPTETRFEEVVRGECREPRRQGPGAADQDPHDRGPQIVVRDTRGACRRSAQTRGRARRES